jgi:hypothetical protein
MDDDLAALEGLHRDLEALRDNRLAVIDRLSAELDSHLEEFQSLFDHKRKNEISRKKLSDGKSYESKRCADNQAKSPSTMSITPSTKTFDNKRSRSQTNSTWTRSNAHYSF